MPSSSSGDEALSLGMQEHFAVLQKCTRDFSDALALVLSTTVSMTIAERVMQVMQ